MSPAIPPSGDYVISTGAKLTTDEALADLWPPGAVWTVWKIERHGPTKTYYVTVNTSGCDPDWI